MDEALTNVKTCRKCGLPKAMDRFASDRKCRDGRSTKCKDCMTTYASERYQRQRLEKGAAYRPNRKIDEWLEIEARGVMRCRRCDEEKPLDEFRVSFRAPRRRRVCVECERKRCAELRVIKRDERKAYTLRFRCRQYGITPRDYERMIQSQGGCCAVCLKPLGQRRQTIDHCHRTGKVRGILHSHCNLVLGNCKEDPEVLRGAIAYLAEHRTGSDFDRPKTRSEGDQKWA